MQKLQSAVAHLPLELLDRTSLKKPCIITELKERITDEIKATGGTLLQRVVENF